LVVIVRCQQEMRWLGPLVRNINIEFGPGVQLAIYERCVEPVESPMNFSGVPLRRQGVQGIFTPTLAIVSHLLVNIRSYASGTFRRTVYVDADLYIPEIADVFDATNWVHWNLEEFIDMLIHSAQPLSIGVGVQVVASTGSMHSMLNIQEHLLRLGQGLVKWDPTDVSGAMAFPKCPAVSSFPQMRELQPSKQKFAIVTYISDATFVTSARVLIHSLLKVGCTSAVIVATIAKSMSYGQQLVAEFPHVLLIEWPYIDPPIGSRAHARWQDNYSKLNLFNMVGYDVLFYVDADIVALQNPETVFESKVLLNSRSPFLGTPDWGAWQRPPSAKLNGGVLLLRPSGKLFVCLLSAMYSTPVEHWTSIEAEQGFLRYFFGDGFTQLPFFFNAQKTLQQSAPELWDRDRTVFLHYVGVKPHRTWSKPAYLRKYRNFTEHEHLRKEDQVDDETAAYEESVRPWRHLFFDLAHLPESLTLFITYTNHSGFVKVRHRIAEEIDPSIFATLALDTPLDSFSVSISGVLRDRGSVVDPQELGEFSALAAVTRADWYTKPWAGFTTSAETQLAVSTEGVSIDWVRAEKAIRAGENQRTILFWYGIFANDYWDMMDLHANGLRQAISDVLDKMGVHVVQLWMPKNTFWPFGHYVIMPTKILREYVAFAEEFIQLFAVQFGSTCPFDIRQAALLSIGTSCLSQALGSLMHIWAIAHGLQLEFVVDNVDLRYQAGCAVDSRTRCRNNFAS